MKHNPIQESLQEVFQHLAAEIKATAGLARKVEEAVALVVEVGHLDHWPSELQHIDQVVQRLSGLVTFCEVLGNQTGSSPMLDIKFALESVQLDSLAQSLSGFSMPISQQQGEVEIFDL